MAQSRSSQEKVLPSEDPEVRTSTDAHYLPLARPRAHATVLSGRNLHTSQYLQAKPNQLRNNK